MRKYVVIQLCDVEKKNRIRGMAGVDSVTLKYKGYNGQGEAYEKHDFKQ